MVSGLAKLEIGVRFNIDVFLVVEGAGELSLDHKTCYCIVKLLVRHIWAEVQGSRPRDQVCWVNQFLGVQHYTEILLNQTRSLPSLGYSIWNAYGLYGLHQPFHGVHMK